MRINIRHKNLCLQFNIVFFDERGNKNRTRDISCILFDFVSEAEGAVV